jgi:uncharacterized OB-fold protein
VSTVLTPSAGRLIDPTLFDEVDGTLRLLGSACDDCATVAFPAQGSCPRCTGQRVHRHPLATEGTLWAFTVQQFPPKPPYVGAAVTFRPYGVGYVDVAGEVLVESRLLVSDAGDLRVGLPMRLVLEALPCTDDEHLWTFAFEPLSTVEPRDDEPRDVERGVTR